MIHLQINQDVRKEKFDNIIWSIPIDQNREHYQLLRFLAKQLPTGAKVADLGTAFGASASAIAEANPSIHIVTYDVESNHSHYLAPPKNIISLRNVVINNITYVVKDSTTCVAEYADAILILLDIGLHDGRQEQIIFDKLIQYEFKGLLLCDDIYCNRQMKSFWNSIRLEKYDISTYGHLGNYSIYGDAGTGLVVFDPKTISVTIS